MDQDKRPFRQIRDRAVWQVGLSYLLSVWAAVQIIDTLGTILGFPDSFTRIVFVLLLAGLPVAVGILALLPRSRAGAAPNRTPAWRPPVLAAVGAFVVLGSTTAGFVGMRTAGFGPAAPLLARGVLGSDDRILLADFGTRTGDTLAAAAATEALRIDLEQSRTVALLGAAELRQALQRMERDSLGRIDAATALEVARREGVKAVLSGELNSAGGRFSLALRLLTAEDGMAVVSLGDVASDSADVIAAVGRLSRQLRERIGEPLRAIRALPPLPRVTTRSLEALRSYAQSREALYSAGDDERALALIEAAIGQDSTFAMAHVQLGIMLLTRPAQAARARAALTTAYRLRERLPGPERHAAQAAYYDDVAHDPGRAIAEYGILADEYPDWKPVMVLNNLALLYERQRDFRRAAEFYARALEREPTNFVPYINLAVAQVALGASDSAAATVERMRARHPEVEWVRIIAAFLASSRWDFAAAEAELQALRAAAGASPYWRAQVSAGLANLARAQDRLPDAERHLRELGAARAELGDAAGVLSAALELASIAAWERGEAPRGLQLAEAALRERPLAGLAPDARPYLQLARLYALAGEGGRATAMLQAYEREVDAEVRRGSEQQWRSARALAALAAGEAAVAIEEARLADTGPCVICALPVLGWAYDRAQQPDSAAAVWRRYLATPSIFRIDEADSFWLVRVRRRLAELAP